MKPFDLEKALAGEPVRLRNGWKTYVKYVMPEQYEGSYPLRGFCIKPNNDICELCWTIEGKDTSDSMTSDLDIVSMWEEPRPRVTLTLPCPLNEPQEDMFFIHPQGIKKSWYSKESHEEWMATEGIYLENGFYFANREDAEEWINVMKGARR